MGGVLSVAQLVADCAATGRWDGITGDAVKFGLGFASIFFDMIFCIQHYHLYTERGASARGCEDHNSITYSVIDETDDDRCV